MHLRTIQSSDGPLLKQLTLRSVEESPHAFGGPQTLAEERARPDSLWNDLAAECAGEVPIWRDRCIGYFIIDNENTTRAKALCFLCDKIPHRAYMTALWVDPLHRRKGLATTLIQASCNWAASKNATHLQLWVDDTNPIAAHLYQSLGFTPTGKSRPVRPNSQTLEHNFQIPLPLPPC